MVPQVPCSVAHVASAVELRRATDVQRALRAVFAPVLALAAAE